MIHFVHCHDVLKLSFVSNAQHFVELLSRGNKDRPGAGVLQNERGLLSRERWIDRNIDHAPEQTCPIGDCPLKPVFGDKRNTVALANPPRSELLCDVVHAGIELVRRDVAPDSLPIEAHYSRQVAIHCSKENFVQRAQAAQERTSIPRRRRSTTGSAAAARSYSRLLNTHAVTSSSIAPKRQAAAILSEISSRILPRC